jgi:hypothetical protein
MNAVIRGGCLCGAIRYESTSELIAPHYCHCRDCQKLYGGPFGTGFIVAESNTSLTGEVSCFEIESDAGRTKSHLFCGVCGSPIAAKVEEFPGVLVLASGTLDDPSLFKPESHYWVGSSPPWFEIHDGLEVFQEQPDLTG